MKVIQVAVSSSRLFMYISDSTMNIVALAYESMSTHCILL